MVPTQEKEPVATGVTLAGMTLETDTCDIDLGGFAGTWRLLFVFAPDCSVCVRTATQLRILRQGFEPDVHFFGIMLNPAAPLDLPKFIEKVGDLGFPAGYCPPGRFNAALGLPKGRWMTFPTLIILGPDDSRLRIFSPEDSIFSGESHRMGAEIGRLLSPPQE